MKTRLFQLVSKTADFLESTKGGVTVSVALTGMMTAAYLLSKDNKQANNPSKARVRMHGCLPFVTFYHEDYTKPQSSMTNVSEGAKLKV